MGYAEYIDIVEAALNMAEAKTKCILVTASESGIRNMGQNLRVGDYDLEVLKEFIYLGS